MKQFANFKKNAEQKEQLNEGLFQYANDLYMAFRIVKILYQDWQKTDAFKLGIIDANGNKVRSPDTFEEKAAYSPFIRLVFRLKRLVGMVPGGQTKIGSLAAAYAMLKENEELDISALTKEQLDALFEEQQVQEDAPTNVSGGVAQTQAPIGTVARRNWKDQEQFASSHVFEVESNTFNKCRTAKIKYDRWDKYVNEEDGDVGQDILKFAKTYPGRGIVLKEKGTGAHVFLKVPK